MKRIITFLLSLVTVFSVGAAEWLTDIHAAQNKAAAEHKLVMLDFTGSDWCGWCMKLKSEVFDTAAFDAFAKENLILVEVDFPHNKQLSVEQKEANETLARTYEIRGYPTLIFTDAKGNKVGRGGYVAGGPGNFIASLEKIPGLKNSANVADATREPEPEAPRRAPPAFVPIAPATPTHYGDLALKAISGAKNRRMALINNETFMVGDTAKVKVHDTKVVVICKEIREDSVLVTVDGKSQELTLGNVSH